MFKVLDMAEDVRELAQKLINEPDILYADIETTGLDWITDKILLFQIMHKGEIYVIDARKLGYSILQELLFWTGSQKFVFHNGKFDLKFIARNTGILLENIYDTMVMEALINSGIGKPTYKLSALAEKYAGVFMDKESRMDFVDYPDDKPFTESMLTYSAIDVKVLEDIYLEQT